MDIFKKGMYVKARYWHGIVRDMVSSNEHCLVLVFSPRGIWRGKPEEWVDAKDVSETTKEDVLAAVRIHRALLEEALQQLQEFEAQL